MKLILVILTVLTSGCASFVSSLTDGHPNRDTIPVVPGSTAVMLTGSYTDHDLDGWLRVPRGAGAFRRNNGIVVMEQKTVGFVESNFNPFVFGNVVYGGVPGAVGDCAVGGMWDLQVRPNFSKTQQGK